MRSAIACRLAEDGPISLFDELDIDLQLLDVGQRVHNVTIGTILRLTSRRRT
jgi:hypothetical protein